MRKAQHCHGLQTTTPTRSNKLRRWLVVVGATLLALALLAFGSYQFAAAADTLHLTVTNTNDPSHSILDVTDTDSAAVQPLLSHILALPDVTGETFSCPIGGPPYDYRLKFSHLGITTVNAIASTEGCRFIEPVFGRMHTLDDQFWVLLSNVAGQPLPLESSRPKPDGSPTSSTSRYHAARLSAPAYGRSMPQCAEETAPFAVGEPVVVQLPCGPRHDTLPKRARAPTRIRSTRVPAFRVAHATKCRSR